MFRRALITTTTLIFSAGAYANVYDNVCTKGIPCGNTCISASYTCHIGQPVTAPTTGSSTSLMTPGAPVGVAATSGSGSASLTFAAPSYDGGSAISSYLVSCVGSAGTVNTTAYSSPVFVSPLVNGITYSCTITAINALGSGLASTAVAVSPKSTTAVTSTTTATTATTTTTTTKPAPSAARADCIMNWASMNLPNLFQFPGKSTFTQTTPALYYRPWDSTKYNELLFNLDTGDVYVIGQLSGGLPMVVGTQDTLKPFTGC